MMGRMGLAVMGVSLMAAAVGCAGPSGDDVGGGGSAAERAPAAPRQEASGSAVKSTFDALGAGGASAAPRFATRLPTVGPSVIKTADVELQVPGDGLRDAVQDAIRVANRHGGFVVSTAVDDAGAGGGNLVVRVPAERFEVALDDLADLGDVRHQEVVGQDVGQEFVDLEARLRNWTAQETVLLRLMDRARTVAASVRVQSQLQQVQLEIERIRGRLRFLEDQTSLGTINVAIAEAGATPDRAGTLERAWERAVAGFLAVVSGVIVATGFALPVVVLAALALTVLRQLLPRATTPQS